MPVVSDYRGKTKSLESFDLRLFFRPVAEQDSNQRLLLADISQVSYRALQTKKASNLST